MKSKISKAHREIVRNTLTRWVHTLTEGAPNVEKAKECIHSAYENGIGAFRTDKHKKMNVTFHVVSSPISFMIAMSVVRGRMRKRDAETLCKEIGIVPHFLGQLRKDSLTKWNPSRGRWWSEPNSEFTRTWLRAIHEEYMSHEQLAATVNGVTRRWWRSRRTDDMRQAYLMNALNTVMPTLRSMLNDFIGLDSVTGTTRGWDGRQHTFSTQKAENKFREIANTAIWDSGTTSNAIGEMSRAIDVTDLLRPETSAEAGSVFLGNVPKAVDAEILCRILKLDNPSLTWEHEVFHHCTAFAAFQQSCIILADRPTLHLNEEGNLHNTEGPAVSWADGARLWFNDGHYLDEAGKFIVAAPEKLSTQHILQIRNEETRRLAIEKFGWDRFIAEANCPILDRRVNDIDNTIEMLVGPPQNQENRVGQNRMVLFCRSTGRRYFLSVPRDVANCEEAQTWMANSGNNRLVPYAAQPIRLVGAS
jgi:hypothetical protein